jgi:glycosyltransferase involved in cell wall biosynthesis
MLEGAEKWGALAASEVFVLPSHQENFGLVVAEAMACGLPVIVSDKVNLWREVTEFSAGLVGEDTVEGTSGSLAQWQSLSKDERAGMKVRVRRCFDERFNYDVTARRTLEIVEELAHAPVQR